jgi:hypothetical protein
MKLYRTAQAALHTILLLRPSADGTILPLLPPSADET